VATEGHPNRRRPAAGTDIAAVARLAGVSTATVSRALRGLPNVSADTRARVLRAALELDYVISPSASRLASGQTHSIGVVTPYLGRWFFGQVLSGAEEVLHAAGFDLLLYALPDEATRADFFTRMPLRRRVDGVLVLTLPMEGSEIEQLGALGVPLASVGVPGPGVSCVGIDDGAAARVAVNHLVNLGHERIALIGGGPSEPIHFTVPHDRLAGYRGAMADAGLPVPDGYEADGAFTYAGGEAAMADLLSLPNPPTAVFAESDEMAIGAMRTIRHSGLRCPDDISIIGFDDHELAQMMDLTTIAQPVHEQGRIAAHLLLDQIAGAEAGDRQLPTRIVLRSSTGPPPERRRR
jgi:LacI family transcriptional regulator, repressor for deo operon, udp, cdd, tsx, nupC, and nupG